MTPVRSTTGFSTVTTEENVYIFLNKRNGIISKMTTIRPSRGGLCVQKETTWEISNAGPDLVWNFHDLITTGYSHQLQDFLKIYEFFFIRLDFIVKISVGEIFYINFLCISIRTARGEMHTNRIGPWYTGWPCPWANIDKAPGISFSSSRWGFAHPSCHRLRDALQTFTEHLFCASAPPSFSPPSAPWCLQPPDLPHMFPWRQGDQINFY